MISVAKAKFVRMSPRKIRYILDLVRNKNVPHAISILENTTRRASTVVLKLVKSAADAAKKNKSKDIENLFISRAFADGAGIMKRFRAMSMGRAGSIDKRLSHVTLELDERAGAAVKPPVQAAAKPEAKPAKKKKLVGQGA